MTNTHNRAAVELHILEQVMPDNVVTEFKDELLALVEKFGQSGQSGGSAPHVARALSQAVEKLCLHKSISPITGMEEEWRINDLSDKESYQNVREGAIFKEGVDGQPYYLNAIVWQGEEKWDTFTGRAMHNGEVIRSSQYIKEFPFTPKTFYVDVIREILPEDWTEAPFIEWDYYDNEEFEKTGVKRWITEKYRNIVKDSKQLEEVFNYYNKK